MTMAIPTFGGPLLSTKEAGDWLGVSPRTLEDWRLRGDGPLFRKLGRRLVRYCMDDLAAFLQGTVRANTGGGLPA